MGASSELGLAYFHLDPYAATLLGLAIVFAGAALAGRLFVHIHQPAVIGEVLVGILLGPSLLGHVSTTLFPLADRPLLQILADVGVAIFVFLVGLELGLSEVRARRHHRIATSVALSSVPVPFGLGVAAAALLHRVGSGAGCSRSASSSASRCRSRRYRCWPGS